MKEVVISEKIIRDEHVFLREVFNTTMQKGVIVETNQGLAYKTELTYIDGVVTAKYLDYENNPVDYNGDIIFEFEGEQQAVQAVNGVAEIPFNVVDAGTYVVKTVNADVDNGEVTING